MSDLLFIDTETGGLDSRVHSIISLAAVVWRDGQLGNRFEVFIREPHLCLDPEALSVNRIDVHWLQRNGKTPQLAVEEFERFICQNFSVAGDAPRVTLAGHNVGFDVGFLKRLYGFSNHSYDKRFGHRSIDTSSILAFLILAKIIPIDAPRSDLAFSYFGIEFEPNSRHTALGDCIATAKMFNRLLNLIPAVGES